MFHNFTPASGSIALTSALIHPDGRLSVLQGALRTDPASIAALGHAVHAAGNELVVRMGAAGAQHITICGEENSLTLKLCSEGVLVLEHEIGLTVAELDSAMKGLLGKIPAPVPVPLAMPLSFSLEDALHATAP